MKNALIYLCLLSLLASCGKAPEETNTSHVTEPDANHDQPWSCSDDKGVAPSGQLSAQRITAADASDGQARLYEGPVWIDLFRFCAERKLPFTHSPLHTA